MGFTQNFHGPVQNVYNVEGTLILGENSGAQDLRRELAALRQTINTNASLPPAVRDRAVAEVDGAMEEAKSAKPTGETIKGRLDGAAGLIESASGVADSGLKLAKLLFDIGKWAFAIFA